MRDQRSHCAPVSAIEDVYLVCLFEPRLYLLFNVSSREILICTLGSWARRYSTFEKMWCSSLASERLVTVLCVVLVGTFSTEGSDADNDGKEQ